VRSFSLLCFLSFHFLFFLFSNESSQFWTIRRREKSLVIIIIIIFLKPIYILTLQNDLSPRTNETTSSSSSRVNNSALEFPFATKEKGEIVFNSIHVDPPINTSRTTKDLRLEEKIIRAKITAIDARSLRSAVVGLIDSIALVVETVERCER